MAQIEKTTAHTSDTESAYMRIGIDAGSKTIKLVLLDPDGKVVHTIYKRHRSNIRETIREAIHETLWLKGDMEAKIAVTGSAGISVSKLLGIPFVQEVVATTEAVKEKYPDADAIIELGGEDAKVAYLTGGVEQRMNATCAGGTGGFIDTIAFMLGVRTNQINTLAMGAKRIYPIASRCAVFAQTDVRPLLNQGASKSDIAASALDAVVRQTLGGLACGRPIRGTVVFLGGPLEYIPALTENFRQALNLDRKHAIKPRDAHLFTATGAAILTDSPTTSKANGGKTVFRLSELEAKLDDPSTDLDPSGLARLAPLFTSEEELEEFRQRHAIESFPVKRMFDAEGPLFLGFDCGSTTVKMALIDEEGTLVYNDYQPSRGDTIETIRGMLASMYVELPTSVAAGKRLPYIAHATATGYGEEMLMQGFGIDSGVVETTAHVRAAREVCPDATFVLDIGGQDMKALWLNGGHISDAVLNEACSSGCGAFVDGTAHSLKSNAYTFAQAALRSEAPVDLGTKCTVFMSSRVKHAQKAGASLEDIAAGVAYSVVHNALYRIIGQDRIKSIGTKAVVQGGSFMSDAILRAFELSCGIEVYRPDRAALMGAIGCALIARDRATRKGLDARSALITREQLKQMNPVRRTTHCTGCTNSCLLSILDFENGRKLVTGNRCDQGLLPENQGTPDEDVDIEWLRSRAKKPLPNLIALEQRLLAKVRATPKELKRNQVTVGVMNALEAYKFSPFWTTFLAELGFTVALPREEIAANVTAKAWETIPAESVCFPAKLTHAKAFDLHDQGVDAIFYASEVRGNHCAVACEYPFALNDSVAFLREQEVRLVTPMLESYRPYKIAHDEDAIEALFSALAPLAEEADEPLTREEIAVALMAALGEQDAFDQKLQRATENALALLSDDPKKHAIILAGRPYHVDPLVMHGIDNMLSDLGFIVLGMSGLEPDFKKVAKRDDALEWKPAKHLMKAVNYVIEHPQVDLVCLQSFGCGYDAMTLEEVRSALEAHGRAYTALKIDEMVETAHIKIRLRTLAESIEGMRDALGKANEVRETSETLPCESASPTGAVVNILEEPLDDDDLAAVRAFTAKDVCFTTNIVAARVIRMLKENPNLDTFVIPNPCEKCLNEAIPRIVERATGIVPTYIWKDAVENGCAHPLANCNGVYAIESLPQGQSLICRADDECPEENPRPRIGVIGNALMTFDPYMNDNIVDMITRLGCDVVLPNEDALYVDDVSYVDQLQAFADANVVHVIYLQSFGCVKGHVQARGEHYKFAEMFPAMPISVIDYDPEASALNRENRIRLIVESVLRDHSE